MVPSHSTRGVAEFLFSHGGPHSAAFVMGFSGERDTPLRINQLNLPHIKVDDEVDDPPSRGAPLAILCGWARKLNTRFWRPTLAPHT